MKVNMNLLVNKEATFIDRNSPNSQQEQLKLLENRREFRVIPQFGSDLERFGGVSEPPDASKDS